MLIALADTNLRYVNLSDNFLDFDGARAFDKFLAKTKFLETLILNNCSLGPKSGEMMAKAQKENKKLKIKNFIAKNNDFETDGFKHLENFFKGMGSIECIDVSHCIKKGTDEDLGMKYLLSGLIGCSKNLREVNISHNNGINHPDAIDEFKTFIVKCWRVEKLNISNLGMKKRHCKAFMETFLSQCGTEWNLFNSLRELEWNDDLKVSGSTAIKFLEEDIPAIYNNKLRKITMGGIFNKIDVQKKMERKLRIKGIDGIFDTETNPVLANI